MPNEPASNKHLLSIMGRMLKGEEFWLTRPPRITLDEFRALKELGFKIQSNGALPEEYRFFRSMPGFKELNGALLEKLSRINRIKKEK